MPWPAGLLVTRDGGATWEIGHLGDELARTSDVFVAPDGGAYAVVPRGVVAMRITGPADEGVPLSDVDLTPIAGRPLAEDAPAPPPDAICGDLEVIGRTFKRITADKFLKSYAAAVRSATAATGGLE